MEWSQRIHAGINDALKVNGFDERMKYGGEDVEFGYRLVNTN